MSFNKSILRKWKRYIGLFLALMFTALVAFGYLYLKGYVVHTISNEPYGINISIFKDENSRGFSWWTKYTKNKKEESLLFISKKQFDINEIYEKNKYRVANDGEIINDDVVLFKGESKTIKANTRLDNIYNVQYINHKVCINNLTDNQQYFYAIGGNGKFVDGSFYTDTDDITTICNFNDFQTSEGKKLYYAQQTLSAMNNLEDEEIDFFAFGGDFTNTFTIEKQRYNKYLGWMKSRQSLNENIGSVPMVMAKGNHDMDISLFDSNNHVDYENDKEHYFSFNYNNVHFVVLDSNNFSVAQKEWLNNDLRNSKNVALWNIIMIHNGPYTTGDHGFNYDKSFVEEFGHICSKNNVDLVLQAHDHTYSKTVPYCWNSKGFYTKFDNVNSVVNLSPDVLRQDGIDYDYRPNGTYYVSCGASGHRIGENVEYAQHEGEKSYINREHQIAIGEIKVNSKYANIGEKSSADLGHTMFGMLYVNKNKLLYLFYVVNEEGKAVLYDQLAIIK